MTQKHQVLILGGGFAGLNAAQKLKRAPVDVTLIDRRNFHLFQPLLYQVATGSRLSFCAAFSPAKPPPRITTWCFCVMVSGSLYATRSLLVTSDCLVCCNCLISRKQ